MRDMHRWPIIAAAAMLVATWLVLRSLSEGEPPLARKTFVQFPTIIGERWTGRDVELDEKILNVLQLTDYLMRVYVPMRDAPPSPGFDGPPKPSAGGLRLTRDAPVWLYVGYYQSQRTGATYHSPKNCLPGAGWQFMDSELADLQVAPERSITINKALIQKGLEKQVVLYWYADRGRVIASEYAAKAYLIWDAMTKNRTDGALVRISVPVTTTVEAATQQGTNFLQTIWPLLEEYFPPASSANVSRV